MWATDPVEPAPQVEPWFLSTVVIGLHSLLRDPSPDPGGMKLRAMLAICVFAPSSALALDAPLGPLQTVASGHSHISNVIPIDMDGAGDLDIAGTFGAARARPAP